MDIDINSKLFTMLYEITQDEILRLFFNTKNFCVDSILNDIDQFIVVVKHSSDIDDTIIETKVMINKKSISPMLRESKLKSLLYEN